MTHSLVIPLDVVKTRLQAAKSAKASEASDEEEGLLSFALRIQRTEGAGALLAGWEPTVLGYLWYGVTVYPGYEFFKRLYVSLCPIEDLKVFLVLLAGATATIFACIGVCPAEACRIRQVCGEERRSLPEVLLTIAPVGNLEIRAAIVSRGSRFDTNEQWDPAGLGCHFSRSRWSWHPFRRIPDAADKAGPFRHDEVPCVRLLCGLRLRLVSLPGEPD